MIRICLGVWLLLEKHDHRNEMIEFLFQTTIFFFLANRARILETYFQDKLTRNNEDKTSPPNHPQLIDFEVFQLNKHGIIINCAFSDVSLPGLRLRVYIFVHKTTNYSNRPVVCLILRCHRFGERN